MKRLVIYYSLRGNTKKIAEMIAKISNADIERITPIKDYNIVTSFTLAKTHIQQELTPNIRPIKANISNYDEIIIGTPVWWHTFVPHIRTFISQNDFKNKNIRLFCTHAGTRGTSLSDMEIAIGDANFISVRDFYTEHSYFKNPSDKDFREITKEIELWFEK